MNTLITYDFIGKENAITSLNEKLYRKDGEEVLDYILSIFTYHQTNYQRLNAEFLRAVLGRNYKTILQVLVDKGLINNRTPFVSGAISRGYILTLPEKKRKKTKRNKYLDILLDESKSYANPKVNNIKKEMADRYRRYMKDLSFSCIDDLKPEDQAKIKRIKEGKLYAKFDTYGGRMYSNMTQLSSIARGRALMDGEKMVEVDIKGSHAAKIYHLSYFFGKKLDINFKRMVERGDLYSYIGYKLGLKRDIAKEAFNQTLNGKLNGYRHWSIVNLFPNLFMEVERIKQLAGTHKVTSQLLQAAERKDVFEISGKLDAMGIKHFTIHDSFMVKESEVKIVQELLLKYNYKSKIK